MLRLILAGVVAMLLVTASPAFADTRTQILRECQDGALTGQYTAKQIRDARNHIPSDIDQYSDCRGVLSRALEQSASGAGGGGGGGTPGSGGGGIGGGGSGTSGTSGGAGGTSGGSAPLATIDTDADRQAIADAAKHGGSPVNVGGVPVTPGTAGLAAGAPTNALPVPVIVALALLGLAALAGLLPLARRAGGLRPDVLLDLGRRVVARGR
jgi:hypothetical protein